MEMIKNIYNRYGGWIYLTGILVLLLGAGFQDSTGGMIALIVGALLVLTDPAVLMIHRHYDRNHVIVWASGFLAILLYATRSSLQIPPGAEDEFLSRVRSALLFLFIIALVLSIVMRLALTLAYNASVGLQSGVYRQRERYLKNTVYSILVALPLFIIVNYLAAMRNPALDLTPGYYSFSDSSSTIVRSLDGNIKIYAFLPVQQAVAGDRNYTLPELYRIAEDVRVMLQQLPNINGSIDLEFMNAELETDRIQEFGNVTNGTIMIRSMKPDHAVTMEDKPYVERKVFVRREEDLEDLERDMVRALLQVSASGKTVYFTAMNGERITYDSDMDRAGGLRKFTEELGFYNFKTKKLTIKEGWPEAVPEDVPVLAIVGPSVPFSDEAKSAVREYLDRGGRVFAAVDPAGSEDLSWLLQHSGTDYRFSNGLVQNVPGFRGVLSTDNVKKHRITESLQVVGTPPIIFPLGGVFVETGDSSKTGETGAQAKAASSPPEDGASQPEHLSMETTPFLFTPYNTLLDKNKNGKKDKNETTGRHPLGVAFQERPKESGDKNKKTRQPSEQHTGQERTKMVVYSGVDWLTNRGMAFPARKANMVLAADSFFFLTESPLAAGLQAEKRESRRVKVSEDVKFRNLLFGVILFPAVTAAGMGLGVFLFRKKRKFAGDQDGAR